MEVGTSIEKQLSFRDTEIELSAEFLENVREYSPYNFNGPIHH